MADEGDRSNKWRGIWNVMQIIITVCIGPKTNVCNNLYIIFQMQSNDLLMFVIVYGVEQ